MNTFIYTNAYIERERKGYGHVHIYIYLHMCGYIEIWRYGNINRYTYMDM